MQIMFDVDRYNELLKKEKGLSEQGNSLIFENKDEFVELLSYNARVTSQISYERKKEYYSLISQYVENMITLPMFQSEFLEMEKKDAEAAKRITNDFKQLASFSVDLKAVEFSSLIGEISDVSIIVDGSVLDAFLVPELDKWVLSDSARVIRLNNFLISKVGNRLNTCCDLVPGPLYLKILRQSFTNLVSN